MELKTVRIEKPESTNFILGQSHFIKTVEDIHEAIVGTGSQIKFGVGFANRRDLLWSALREMTRASSS